MDRTNETVDVDVPGGHPATEIEQLHGQLAVMREAIDHGDCEHSAIVADACIRCPPKHFCPMGIARSSDVGKAEAKVISAAVDLVRDWERRRIPGITRSDCVLLRRKQFDALQEAVSMMLRR